ncbi:MAG: hypothetical protein M3Y44_05970 [Actinomycetota bacterium]|nr:hypothetical protein [Actinomycetota bacterium]
MSSDVRIVGRATAEELAAVVALMSHLDREREPDRYTEWRRARLAAVRPSGQRPRADRSSPEPG